MNPQTVYIDLSVTSMNLSLELGSLRASNMHLDASAVQFNTSNASTSIQPNRILFTKNASTTQITNQGITLDGVNTSWNHITNLADVVGENGPTGPSGSSPVGIIGVTGPTGGVGSNGPNGPNGILGATGPSGPLCISGILGKMGATGSTGANGAGIVGSIVTTTNVSSTGDLNLNATGNILWNKPIYPSYTYPVSAGKIGNVSTNYVNSTTNASTGNVSTAHFSGIKTLATVALVPGVYILVGKVHSPYNNTNYVKLSWSTVLNAMNDDYKVIQNTYVNTNSADINLSVTIVVNVGTETNYYLVAERQVSGLLDWIHYSATRIA